MGRSVYRRVPLPNCRACGAPMKRKTGRNGPFLSCTRYPGCTEADKAFIGIACPRPLCTGALLERLNRNTDGAHQMMVSCSEYPKCRFSIWQRVEEIPCFWCGLPVTIYDRSGPRSCIDPSCVSHSRGDPRMLDHVERALNSTGTMKHAAQLLATAAGFASRVAGVPLDELLKFIEIGRHKIDDARASDGGAP